MNVKILCTYEVSCYLSLFLGMTHVVLSIHCSIRLLFYLGSHQSPVPSYQGNYVCSDISHELIHHKIIQVPFRQPSTVFQPTGAAGEADHVEPGSVPSSLTCNRPTLASTRRGFVHKIVPNGVQLWRRLCSPLGVPPDDDDDECTV